MSQCDSFSDSVFLSASSADTPLRQPTPPTILPHPQQQKQEHQSYFQPQFFFEEAGNVYSQNQHYSPPPPPPPPSASSGPVAASCSGNLASSDIDPSVEELASHTVTELTSLQTEGGNNGNTGGAVVEYADMFPVPMGGNDIVVQSMFIALGPEAVVDGQQQEQAAINFDSNGFAYQGWGQDTVRYDGQADIR